MSATINLRRDYCYKCDLQLSGIVILACPKCGNRDLIPNPNNGIELTNVEVFPENLKLILEQENSVPIEKSVIELDPNIVEIVLNSDFLFVTGLAGTGKSTLIREICRQNPNFAELTSTTGIAAINLGGKTINSTLKYFNTASLRKSWESGYLHMHLRAVRNRVDVLVIEEISMMDAEALDYIIDAVDEINNDLTTDRKLGVHLIGDLCFKFGTKIMMADGSLKLVEDIIEGDQVMGPDSMPRNVLKTCRGADQLYKVHQTNGIDYIVNSNHIIPLIRSEDGKRVDLFDKKSSYRYAHLRSKTAINVVDLMNKSRKFKEVFVGYKAGLIKFNFNEVHIDPYFLGIWLGDGDSDALRITNGDNEIIEACSNYAEQFGLTKSVYRYDRTHAVRVGFSQGRIGHHLNPLWEKFKLYDLPNNKHIPNEYLYNSERVRLELLAGLIDSDGSWSGNRYTISLTNKKLIYQVKQLADQLGFRASINSINNGIYKSNINNAWIVTIGGDTWNIPCRVQRKISVERDLVRSRLTSVLTITKDVIGDYAGFEVDGDNLFLLEDGTVAHNCQLPPIKAAFVFRSKFWDRFERNTLKLEKIWRQDNPAFIHAINLVRKGDGKNAVIALMDCGVKFTQALDDNFDGTTIIPKNDEVDAYNSKRLAKVQSSVIRVTPTKRGKQLGEWEKNIPYELQLKIGAYVMILSNDYPEFRWVNGDTGIIEGYDSLKNIFSIRLKRNDEVVKIMEILRENTTDIEPDSSYFSSMYTPTVNQRTGQWILGTIKYMPLRLAYASTCHKSQGLSLDKVQIDSRHQFFGSDNMAYVAISRCRTPEGLTIIGNPSHVASKIRSSKEVQKWI